MKILDSIRGSIQKAVIGFRHKIWRYSQKRKPKITPHSGQAPVHGAHTGRRHARRRNAARKRIIYIAAASLVVVTATVVLLVTLTGGEQETAAVAAANVNIPPAKTKEPGSATLMMPALAPVSITKGMSASIIEDVQIRLMELGYMDKDEPDGIYGEATVEGMQRFQKQNGLEITDTIDQHALDLLNSADAQEYVLTVGAEDTDVSELQQRLCELDYMSTATGYFGTDTEDAVKKFQKMNGLVEDGKVGKNTRELLYSGEAVPNAFSYGEESPEILDYQNRLKKLGYLMSVPDGKFGPDTKAAVRRFQENSGLIADGYIGTKTKAALMSDDAQRFALSIGAKGDDVVSMQKYLVKLGYLKKADGYFGSKTDTAVRSFQNNNKLKVDGKVGAITKAALMSPNAKKSTGVNVTGSNVNSLIEVALSKLGCKYVRGAKGPSQFDCSGFVYWCINKVGIKQGYMTSRTWAKSSKYTKINNMGDLKKGDIIVYDGHVAICAGGGYMIDASSHNKKVVKRKYTGSSYWKSNFVCGFRIF